MKTRGQVIGPMTAFQRAASRELWDELCRWREQAQRLREECRLLKIENLTLTRQLWNQPEFTEERWGIA